MHRPLASLHSISLAIAVISSLGNCQLEARNPYAPRPTAPRRSWRRRREPQAGKLIRRAFDSRKVTPDSEVPRHHLPSYARSWGRALGEA